MGRFKHHQPAPCLSFDKCWGKTDSRGYPGVSVVTHCRTVGWVAAALLQHLPDKLVCRLGDNPVLAAALHDVGKISPGFQLKYFRQNLAQKNHPLAAFYSTFDENHAGVSEVTLSAVYGDGKRVPQVAQVAGVHHGVREEKNQITDDYITEAPEWREERRKFIRCMVDEFGELGAQPGEGMPTMLLAGLVCVADWIASDEALFDSSQERQELEGSYLKIRAQEAVSLCGWRKARMRSDVSFEEAFGFPPNQMQAKFVSHIKSPGVYVLEAPTGMGKTEAALFAAYELMKEGEVSGFYFGLPTRLTSDRIHIRVNEFLQKICIDERNARLAHGNAWLSRFSLDNGPADEQSDDNVEAWFNPLKRALLYPLSVGTVDQALLGVLNVRHFFLRLFGLAGKAVILDEVHSYDVFTGSHLDTLVEVLKELDCAVIILSATLTAGRRADLAKEISMSSSEEYPLLTTPDGAAYSSPPPADKNIRIKLRQWSGPEVAEAACENALRGANVLCVANTVAQAQQWYRTIKAEMGEGAFEIGLLHSKFLGVHREGKEEHWMCRLGKTGVRTKGSVLVATQVVEQSVDIDADLLITELAPTDMLIQRLGRLWRHEREHRPLEEPAVIIITGHLSDNADADQLCESLGVPNTRVYSPYILCRSYAVWKNYDGRTLSLPAQVRELLHDTYEAGFAEPPAWEQLRQAQEKTENRLRRMAAAFQAGVDGMPVGRDDEKALTRYNDRPMQDAVIVRDVDDRGSEATVWLLSGEKLELSAFQRNIHAAASLRSNMLSLPAYLLPHTASPPAWLRKNLDARTMILTRQDDGTLYSGEENIGLSYDSEKGLQRISSLSVSLRLHKGQDIDIFKPYSDYDVELEGEFNELSDW